MTVEQLWEQSQDIFPFCASYVSVVSSARAPASIGAWTLLIFVRINVLWFEEETAEERELCGNSQGPGLMLPDSDLVLLLIYLRELESPWAFAFLLGNFRLLYFS